MSDISIPVVCTVILGVAGLVKLCQAACDLLLASLPFRLIGTPVWVFGYPLAVGVGWLGVWFGDKDPRNEVVEVKCAKAMDAEIAAVVRALKRAEDAFYLGVYCSNKTVVDTITEGLRKREMTKRCAEVFAEVETRKKKGLHTSFYIAPCAFNPAEALVHAAARRKSLPQPKL